MTEAPIGIVKVMKKSAVRGVGDIAVLAELVWLFSRGVGADLFLAIVFHGFSEIIYA
tara:strand:- start:88 stop:258 length:171 start_codon:yes stop_codon:yes gene_type:complete